MTGLLQRALAAALVGLVVAAGACSSNGGPTDAATATPSPGASGNAVVIQLVAFHPEAIEIAAGASVTWRQTDRGSVHTVTSGTVVTDATGAATTTGDGRFDSGQLTQDATFSHTFRGPGT
ncbi:MAG: cupredoxin domain-containing protein [Actinomycetota bacterium]